MDNKIEKETKGTHNGHEWVDLGLPSGALWATCNIGANSPTDYGCYFSWGETSPKSEYPYGKYKYFESDLLTKYNAIDGKKTLDIFDDAATVNWGLGWRMPTETEIRELIDNCIIKMIVLNNTRGCLFTGPNGNSIFLPAAGYYWGKKIEDVKSCGAYWSSSRHTSNPSDAWQLEFLIPGECDVEFYGRYCGHSVRAVCSVILIPVDSFSICENESKDIKPISSDLSTKHHNDHECVDLGLPSGTRWAICNVGATNPEDYGNYFAWGETSAKAAYNLDTYRWANGFSWGNMKLTKYCNKSYYGNNGFSDNLITLEANDDAATVNWGANWRMPTKAEIEELGRVCSWTWVSNGYKVVGPNGNSIFLPAAGYYSGCELRGIDSEGGYWSSSLDLDNPDGAWTLYFDPVNYRGRYYGRSVRPVYKEKGK